MALILQALDGEVAIDVGCHLVCLDHGSLQGGVTARADAHRTARHLRVGERDTVARALARGFAGTGCDAHAAAIAQLHGHAHAGALALVAAALAGGVLCGQQVHLVVRLQAGGACGFNAAALHCEVAALSIACGLDRDIAACRHAGAPGVVCAGALLGLAAARSHADADANAACFVGGVAVFDGLPRLHRIGPLFEVHRHVGPGQQLHAATAGVACGLQLALHGPINRVHGGDFEKSGVETDLGTTFIRQARTGKISEGVTLSLNTTGQFFAVIFHVI